MNCPRCESALVTRKINGVEVDECPDCRGVWFDSDELRKAKDESDPDLAWMDFELWKHDDRFRVSGRQLSCPRCSTELVAIDYDVTGIEVDFCPGCRGVWLDADEFGKIVDSLTEELLSKDVPDYLRATVEEAKELVSGGDGLLSEWKDLTTVLRMLQYRILSENPKVGRLLAELQAKSQF